MSIGLRDLKMDLIKNSNFGRYLIYVLGEICLVVIGILVALQFNDMKIAEQDRTIELQYYQTIKDQLTEDRAILAEEVKESTRRLAAYSAGKKIIKEGDRTQLDELGKVTLELISYGDFRRTSTVYQTLIYSGEIKYIQNKKIVGFLQEIERNYGITERLEALQADLVISHSAPAILGLIDFESGKILSPDLVFTPTFSNRFSGATKIVVEKVAHFEDAIKAIDSTLKTIETELTSAGSL